MKIRPLGTELFRADGHDEAKSGFFKISKKLKNLSKIIQGVAREPRQNSHTNYMRNFG
jgi:hypothetical protein